jgi:group I intron endonuclease
MEILKNPGVYLIYNLVNQKVYVGQSRNVRNRLFVHKSSLRLGKHVNTYLQNAFNKYGEDKFVFRSVEYCEIENLTEREEYWMDQFNSTNLTRGYNLMRAKTHGGISEETRAKMSKARKGKIHSEESRAKISVAKKGKIISEEHRAKMSEVQKGKILSEEHRAKIGASQKGKVILEETRAKISEGNKGKIRSEEHRAKTSASVKLQWEKRRSPNAGS